MADTMYYPLPLLFSPICLCPPFSGPQWLRTTLMTGVGSICWPKNLDLLDQGWSHLLKHPDKSEDIPEEHRSNVLTAGYNVWINSSHLTTTRGAVLFKQMLNVLMVSSTFQYYKDCFLFALSVSWDVDVQRFDLTPDQSQAAFAYVDIMRQAQRVSPLRDGPWRGKRWASAGNNAGDGAQRETQAGKHEGPTEGARYGEQTYADDKYALSPGHLKDLRKRAGACRLTQKLCRVLESYLRHLPEAASEAVRAAGHDGGADASMLGSEGDPLLHWELALAIWETILKCDDDAKSVHKDKARNAKKKEKKARCKGKSKGKRSHSTRASGSMYCDSSSSDYGSTTSSSSSSSSGGRRSGRGTVKDISNYDKLFEESKDAPGAPPFIYVKGVPHFRSKTTGDLVNAGKPPNTPCRSCQKCHWYWQGSTVGCHGNAARKR